MVRFLGNVPPDPKTGAIQPASESLQPMKILTSEQMREADRHTIQNLGVPSLQLMERAGKAVADRIASDAPSARHIGVVCGSGNNGGDGWVVARLLRRAGKNVHVIPVAERGACSPDCGEMWARAEGEVSVGKPGDSLGGCDLIVDAVYGTGLDASREIEDERVKAALRSIREIPSHVPVWSVDIPSGLDATSGKALSEAVVADVTVTFQYPKLGMFQGRGPDLVGRLEVADIGIVWPQASAAVPQYIEVAEVRALLPKYPPSAYKRTRGSILCVGGSTTMPGSIALTAYGALRAGAGLATCAVPESIHPIVAAYFPEVMTVPLPDAGMGCLTPEGAEQVVQMADRFDVLALGPGLTTQPPAREAVRTLLEETDRPLVLDADGLNCLADLGPIARAGPLTLTPHPGEMARLLGTTSTDVLAKRFQCASDAAARFGATIVSKGAYTIICSGPSSIWVNPVASPVLGTAGSGDVLTGAVAALTHRAGCPVKGAVLATYLHSVAGLRCAEKARGALGCTATDIAQNLPLALSGLYER